LGLSVVFCGLTASSAYATISLLPDPQWYSDARAVQNTTVIDQPSSLPGANTSSASDASGTSTVTINSVAGPTPSVSAQASSSTQQVALGCNPCGGYAYGTGQLIYYAEVVDPTGATNGNLIPINVSAYGSASSTGTFAFGGQANANLWLTFYGQGASPQQYFQAVSNNGAPTSYINLNNAYQAGVGQPIFVEMYTSVWAGSNMSTSGGSPSNAASAYVDPYFSLPQWAINAGYQLDFSAGIGNSPVSAPGPTPGAGLLGLAFFVLAGAMTKARGFLAS